MISSGTGAFSNGLFTRTPGYSLSKTALNGLTTMAGFGCLLVVAWNHDVRRQVLALAADEVRGDGADVRHLERAAGMMEGRLEEFVGTMQMEAGFTVSDATGEVRRCIQTLKLSAEEARRLAAGNVRFMDLARRLERLEKSVAAHSADTRKEFVRVYKAILKLVGPAPPEQ